MNRLPNLQLLPGQQNTEKQATLPAEWLAGPSFPSEEARQQYFVNNDLGLDSDIDGFLEFYAARRERMTHRLRSALGLGVDAEAMIHSEQREHL